MFTPYINSILLAGGEFSTFPSGYGADGKPVRFRAVIVLAGIGAAGGVSVSSDAETPALALAGAEKQAVNAASAAPVGWVRIEGGSER